MILTKVLLPVLSVSFLAASSADSIYQSNCASCHGNKGEKKALGRSNMIKGMPTEAFVKIIHEFVSGEKKSIIIAKRAKKRLINTHNKEEIQALAEYVNKL